MRNAKAIITCLLKDTLTYLWFSYFTVESL